MISIFLLHLVFSMFSIHQCANIVTDVSSACRCKQIMSEGDCNIKCKWNTDKQQCHDRLCTEISDPQQCFKRGCGYQNGMCQSFEGCQSIQSREYCTSTLTCTYSNNYTCEDVTVTQIDCLNSFIRKVDCNSNIDSNGNYCVWIDGDLDENAPISPGGDDGTCKGYAFTTCDSANLVDNIEQLCLRKPKQCIYQNKQCQQIDYKSFTTKSDCDANLATIESDNGGFLLCGYNFTSNSCENGYDIEQLTQKECYSSSTLFQLSWDSNTKLCTKFPGYSNVLLLSLIIYILYL